MNELENDTNRDYILNDLEAQLIQDLEGNLEDLEFLKDEEINIGDPESIGETMKNIVWEQFQLSIGMEAGESFIEENDGVNFDPRKSAHVQTSENFEKGKIAKNNKEINYQDRHDNWQNKLEKTEGGVLKTHKNRVGKTEANIKSRARAIFDKNRPTGSLKNKIDMDHTVSASEIIRDPKINTFLNENEQISFANSKANLKEMNSSHNRSKNDKKMSDWLDNPNSNGQKPNEIFNDLDKSTEAQYKKNDKLARAEKDKRLNKKESEETKIGKKSRINEAKKIGKQSLKAILFSLLAELLKTIVNKLVIWFKSAEKNFSSFLEQMKEAIRSFFKDLKRHLTNAADTFLTTIFSAIWGPIIGTIKKAWMFIKQGWKSLKEAIQYIKNPQNSDKSISVIMLQVSKIIVAGLTVGGALLLGETIEKGLITIAPLAVPIPVLGSIASIMGVFLGALISGLIGALALNLIDRVIVKKQKEENRSKQIEKQSEILDDQVKLLEVKTRRTEQTKLNVSKNIIDRHKRAKEIIDDTLTDIKSYNKSDELFDKINDL
jgi:hypothetical protein